MLQLICQLCSTVASAGTRILYTAGPWVVYLTAGGAEQWIISLAASGYHLANPAIQKVSEKIKSVTVTSAVPLHPIKSGI